jgi:hypothetical protein
LPSIVLGIISDPDAFLWQPVIATVSPLTSCLKCRLADTASGGLAKLLTSLPHPTKRLQLNFAIKCFILLIAVGLPTLFLLM